MSSKKKQLILGTAGHIDHGKTTLIKALTGIDTDRLEEEKKRGISIELGFAQLSLPSGRHLGIVDVPGHEKFVKNMVAGATGIDIVLLVVAADDSVMPQTEEHLAIVDLLGIKDGVVALTKTDLVDDEWLPLVEDEIRAVLEKTALKDAPIVPVSGKTREGLDRLREAIDKVAQRIVLKEDQLPFRLPIDRVFTMPGAGTVVTGTLWSGKIKQDDRAIVYPSSGEVRVRSIQVHGEKSDMAVAGQRVALNFAGLDKEDINRGDVILAPGYLSPSHMFDAWFRLINSSPRELKNRARIRVNHGTKEVLGRIVMSDREVLKPGETVFVQMHLEKPLVLKYNDNFIVRSYSPVHTIGGGRILDSHPVKYRKSYKSFTRRCQVLLKGEPGSVVRLYLGEAKGFLTLETLTARCELEVSEVKKSLAGIKHSGKLMEFVVDKRKSYMMKVRFNEYGSRLGVFLKENFKKNPLNPWVGKQVIKSQLFDWMTDKEFDVFLFALQQEDKIFVEKSQVAHAESEVSVKAEDEKTMNDILKRIADGRYSPPETTVIAKELGFDVKKVNSMADLMVREHKLARIAPNMYFEYGLIEQAKAEIKNNFSGKKITPAEVRDILDTSRKYIIPILNYFDTIGITRRQGETRVVR